MHGSCNSRNCHTPEFSAASTRFTFPFQTEAAWAANTDPYDEELLAALFEQQLAHKLHAVSLPQVEEPPGKILVANYEECLTEGVSESVSLGLFDVYDCPPIDTWFYRVTYEGRQLLLAWMPEQFVKLSMDAMFVNSTADMGWFSDWFPEEYARLFGGG